MKNRLFLIAVMTATVTLSDAHAALAETVSYNFTVDVLSGPLSGESYIGVTSVDLTDPITNNENIKTTSITFSVGGVEFTEADDVQDIDANSPRANFQNGEFLGNTYIVSRLGNNPTEIPLVQNVSIDGFAIDNSDFGYVVGADLYRGTVRYFLPPESNEANGPTQSVPEPSMWLGLATIGCTAGYGRRLTRRAS
ncbi:hypothetical protein [Leptothoe spongobia]|uniref:PEP-CTERM sorting domain-containing protein n=1 Tax=Leptothoe spongobia TAU-MAC 1115 TaxID=1967444 RepID=A0A947DF56_9CYAN|nr:hypothetical protein [Leptothoe spongobia]MBT9315982.1 hypothetical protein [Leptothoe spongobia TAU-MAC 1115]